MPPQLSPSPLLLIFCILLLSFLIMSSEIFYSHFSQDSKALSNPLHKSYPLGW